MHTDIAIIGFGKAGKTIAAAAAKAGKKVVLIEKDPERYGGTCPNVACMPTKFLQHRAGLLRRSDALRGERTFEQRAADYAQAIADKRTLTAALRAGNFTKVDSLENASVLTGAARFVSDHELEVTTADGEVSLTADAVVINTGSSPKLPDIDGIAESARVVHSDGLMEIETLPRRMGILGAGYIGKEFAGIYSAFGSEVTMLHSHAATLPREDDDDAAAIEANLAARGVKLELEARLVKVTDVDDETVLTYEVGGETREIAVDLLLVSTGRKPNVDGLGLENTGVKLGDGGEVAVDDHLRTSVPGIWAAGDVKGGAQFTYVSLDDYRIIMPQLMGGEPGHDAEGRGAFPYTVFLDPPFSRVGHNEKSAAKAGIDVEVRGMPASAIPKAKVLGETDGHIKVLVDRESQAVVGATLFMAESHEVINFLTLAINQGLTAEQVGNTMFNHPVMHEAFNELLG